MFLFIFSSAITRETVTATQATLVPTAVELVLIREAVLIADRVV